MSTFRENRGTAGSSKHRLMRLAVSLLFVILVSGTCLIITASPVKAATNGFKIVTENGKKVCYYYKNGSPVKNLWIRVNGKRYYFDSSGHQVTGWQNGKGSAVKRFFFTTLGKKGYMATGFVVDSSGKVRYFDTKTGVMARGFKTINGGTRYFDKKTGALYTGCRKIGKYFYFFKYNSNIKKRGIIYTKGWYTTGSTKYYFDTKDGHAHIGWMTLNGKRYYFSSKGHLYYSRTFKVKGKTYTADANGVVTEGNTSNPVNSSTYTDKKSFSYKNNGSYVTVYDSKNGRNYNLVSEFATDYGVANGASTDRDILAALCEAEAGDQGLIGMEAVAMCVLNRTIKQDKEFPSEVRLVVYQTGPRQYTTTIAAVNRRLKGTWINKKLAYEAADAAIKIFTAYRNQGTARVIKGFYNNKDVNFMYFMMSDVFSYSYSRGGFSYVYKDHTFFVDWA